MVFQNKKDRSSLSNRSSLPRNLTTLGLLSLGLFSVACGELQSENSEVLEASYTMEMAEAQAGVSSRSGGTRAQAPVSDYYDDDGNYFLQCNTGAAIGTLAVTPEADLNGWMQACMDSLVSHTGGAGVTDAQLRECRSSITRQAFRSERETSGSGVVNKAAGPPITNFKYNGSTWAACHTGADLNAFQLPGGEGEYQAWRQECLSYGTGGGGLGSIGEAHVGLLHQVAGSGASNPICGGLFHSTEVRKEGTALRCSTNNQVIPSLGDLTLERTFVQACKGSNDLIAVAQLQFVPGSDLNSDLIYFCSGTGQSVLHSQGFEALIDLFGACRHVGGAILSREFSNEGVAAVSVTPHQYLCTSTGETLPHGNDVSTYQSFLFGCSLAKGAVRIIASEDASRAPRNKAPVGRTGRGDIDLNQAHIEMANVVSGTDMNGNTIYICMPKGNHIGPGVTYQEFTQFESECIQSGGIVQPRLAFEPYIERIFAY